MDLSHVAGTDALVYGGGITGLILFGLSILRTVGMKLSKDTLTLTEDSAQRDTIGMLQRRIDRMDSRIATLEISRNKWCSFSMNALAYISQCLCVTTGGSHKPSREELEKEFQRILLEEQQTTVEATKITQ